VVATRVGGIPQILGEPVPPFLGAMFAPGDLAGLVAALSPFLARDPDRVAVRAFAQRYGWDEPVAMLVRTFRAALQEVG
jgi:hypothetical protein